MRWDSKASSWSVLPRAIDDLGAAQRIWFRAIADIAGSAKDQDYFLYAQNPGAQPVPFDPGVFEFYNGFDASSADWTQTGNVTFSAGSMVLDGAGSGGSVRSANKTYGNNTAIDFRMVAMQNVAGGSNWFCGGFQRQSDFTDTVPWTLWISRSSQTSTRSFGRISTTS